jgi:phosphoribosylaminoimidazole carboxylase (NCAIR synthetase)
MAKNEVAVIEKELSPAVAAAEKLAIKTPDDMAKATEMLSKLNKVSDALTAEKERVTKPLLEALKAERSRWKPAEVMYENAVAFIRRKMTEYQTAAKKKADAEALKIAERVGDGKGKLKIETAVRKIGEIDTPAKAVTTGAGMVKFKTVKKFEVLDKTIMPFEFLVPDEVAIRKAMLAGHEIKGVRYYEEEVPLNYR